MLGYWVPAPDEALLISGGKPKTDEAPFRVITGRGAFVVPFFRKADLLSLAINESRVEDRCVTSQGIGLKVSAVIAFKVSNSPEAIVSAAQRFLSDQARMNETVGEIFAGHLRSIVGSMTVEDIIRNRQELATNILDTSKIEMGKMGLVVDSMQIKSIDDMGSGYIDALSAPHVAAVQRDAKIAQAKADQAATESQQESQRNQAEYLRQTAVVNADYKAQTDTAQAKSDQAGPLALAQAQQEVLAEQSQLARKRAELREQELQAEVIKPAEAEAKRVQILAQAEAEQIKALASAAASSGRIALDQQLIEQMPQIVEAASRGLAGANLTVLNGQEGVNDILTSLIGQGVSIYRSLIDNVDSNSDGRIHSVDETEEDQKEIAS